MKVSNRKKDKYQVNKIMDNQGLIGDCFRRYKTPPTWENEDWLSELRLVYVRACLIHRESKGRLSTIMDRLARNEWMTAVKKAKASKRGWGFTTLHLGELIDDDGVGYEPSRFDIKYDTVDAIDEYAKVIKKLSPRELDIFKLRAQGYSGLGIANKLGLSRSNVNKIMEMARRRLRNG